MAASTRRPRVLELVLIVLTAGVANAARQLPEPARGASGGAGPLLRGAASSPDAGAAFGALSPGEASALLRRLQAAHVTVGSDDMTEVVSPLPYPFSALGLLVFADNSTDGRDARPASGPAPGAASDSSTGERGGLRKADFGICTGFMISPDTLLTAAHCLYDVASPKAGRPAGFRKILGFYPSYSRDPSGAKSAPLGYVRALWTDVSPEWVEAAQQGVYQWRADFGVVRLDQKAGLRTGYFGLASGCDVAASLLQGVAKERSATGAAAGADAGAASAASAAMTVAGFPGQSMVFSKATGKLFFPLMEDDKCALGAQSLCPSDARAPLPPPGAPEAARIAGMVRHTCDTGKGMSGAPLWVRYGSAGARAAADYAVAEGLLGSAPLAGGDYDASEGDASQPAAVAVAVVSRHTGSCPWGPDCQNLAAPVAAHGLDLIRQWVGRG